MQRRYFRVRDLASQGEREGLLPVSVATIWRWVAEGKFPRPVQLSPGVTAWPVEAIEAWQAAQAARATIGRTAKAAAASVAAREAKRVRETA
jgi:predicted DNA-binding transcriptional regulator AlpA